MRVNSSGDDGFHANFGFRRRVMALIWEKRLSTKGRNQIGDREERVLRIARMMQRNLTTYWDGLIVEGSSSDRQLRVGR